MIIIIQHLYSAIKSEDTEAFGDAGLSISADIKQQKSKSISTNILLHKLRHLYLAYPLTINKRQTMVSEITGSFHFILTLQQTFAITFS